MKEETKSAVLKAKKCVTEWEATCPYCETSHTSFADISNFVASVICQRCGKVFSLAREESK